MKNKKKISMLITAGPTIEPIDPVRFISNRSTGTMGYTLAREAAAKGFHVVLVSGPVCLDDPEGVEVIRINTAEEMKKKVNEKLRAADCLIMAAAVCDFRPEKAKKRKIKKTPQMTIKMTVNPDILKELKGRTEIIKIGFALETNDLEKNARGKLKNKNIDLIVANIIKSRKDPFGEGEKDFIMISKKGGTSKFIGITKEKCARIILDKAEMMVNENAGK